jgi:hypothetical protein
VLHDQREEINLLLPKLHWRRPLRELRNPALREVPRAKILRRIDEKGPRAHTAHGDDRRGSRSDSVARAFSPAAMVEELRLLHFKRPAPLRRQ